MEKRDVVYLDEMPEDTYIITDSLIIIGTGKTTRSETA